MANGFAWTNGGLEGIRATLDGYEGLMVEKAVEILEGVVWEAALDQAEILEAAVTRTGERRVASGRGEYPGRHESGAMINEISNGVTVEGNVVTGHWGWEDPEEYFLDQDLDTVAERIPAAHSLRGSFIKAVQNAQRALIRASKGK